MTPSPRLELVAIVGASGQFGSALARLFLRRGVRVCGIGRSPAAEGLADLPGYTHIRTTPGEDGMGEITPALRSRLPEADCLILSTPIHTLPTLVRRYGEALSPGALLCDVGSIKEPVEEAMRGLGREDLELLGIHPLFAPTLPLRGQNIAFVPTRTGPRSEALLGILAAEGANLVRMTAEEHDALMAFSQGLSHALVTALGRVAQRRGLDLGRLLRISTPFNRCLLLLLGRMASFDAGLYAEIQVANPRHAEMLDDAVAELRELQGLLASGDRGAVRDFMASPRASFGGDPHDVFEAAHALFTVLPDPTCDDPPGLEPTAADLAPPVFRRARFVEDPEGHARKAAELFLERYAPEAEATPVASAEEGLEGLAEGGKALIVPMETSTRADLGDTCNAEHIAREGLRFFAEVIVPGTDDSRMRYVAIANRDQPAARPAKTSVLVELEKDRPGALYRMLTPFAIRKINLTRIASYPSRRMLGEYFFQLDFLGSRLDSAVLGALTDAERLGRHWILGSYPVDA